MAKAIVVAAPASGSGKTLITLGLLRAFRNRGMRVAAAKAGPDYIDPRFHEAATGRACYNLDPWAMSPAMIGSLMADLVKDSDLVIIEGFKSEGQIPRIEVRRQTNTEPPIFPRDPNVVAVAADHAIDTALPVLDLNDAATIAQFVIDHLKLPVTR